MPWLLAGVVALSAVTGAAAGSAATYATLANQPRPLVSAIPAEKIGSGAPVVSDAKPETSGARPAGAELRPVAAVTGGALATGSTATEVYQKAGPAVVSIRTVGGRGTLGASGAGTGFVVDDKGYLLTNYHVVDGAGQVRVQLADGAVFDAQVVGTDPASDLALLRAELPKDRITVARLGDSDQVQVGEPAIAIGNPFDLEQTVTMGIVSAKNRDFGTAGGRPMRGLIQTDAPINPGNSGGPLFNARGEVIGITTAIESPVRGSVGIGFALPINRAKHLLPQLQRGETPQHPYLGISGRALTPELARQLRLSQTKGILIAEVVPSGPAARAGLRGGQASSSADLPEGGDVILEIDGRPIGSVQELSAYLEQKQVGDTVTLKVLREGQQRTIQLTLGAWPASSLR